MALKTDIIQTAADKIGTSVAAAINALASIWTKFTTAVTDGVNASNGLKEGGSVLTQLKDVSGNKAMFIQHQMSPDIIYSLDASNTNSTNPPITGSSPTTALFDVMTEGFGGISISLFGTYTGQAFAYEKFDGAIWSPLFGGNPASPYAQVPTAASGSGSSVNVSLDGAIRVRIRVSLLATGIVYASVSMTVDRPTSQTIHCTTTGSSPDGVIASGNPVQIGGRANSTMPTPIANGQTAVSLFTLDRRLIIQPYSIPEVSWSNSITITNSTAAVTLHAVP